MTSGRGRSAHGGFETSGRSEERPAWSDPPPDPKQRAREAVGNYNKCLFRGWIPFLSRYCQFTAAVRACGAGPAARVDGEGPCRRTMRSAEGGDRGGSEPPPHDAVPSGGARGTLPLLGSHRGEPTVGSRREQLPSRPTRPGGESASGHTGCRPRGGRYPHLLACRGGRYPRLCPLTLPLGVRPLARGTVSRQGRGPPLTRPGQEILVSELCPRAVKWSSAVPAQRVRRLGGQWAGEDGEHARAKMHRRI